MKNKNKTKNNPTASHVNIPTNHSWILCYDPMLFGYPCWSSPSVQTLAVAEHPAPLHTYMHTHSHTHMHTHTLPYTHLLTHACMHTHKHTHTPIHTHRHTLTYPLTCAHTTHSHSTSGLVDWALVPRASDQLAPLPFLSFPKLLRTAFSKAGPATLLTAVAEASSLP